MQHSVLHLKVFFLELAQSGYQGPEFSCPDHDSTSTGTIGTCLLYSPAQSNNFEGYILQRVFKEKILGILLICNQEKKFIIMYGSFV